MKRDIHKLGYENKRRECFQRSDQFKAIRKMVILSVYAFLIVPTPVVSQEAEVRAALMRTFDALNAKRVDEFLSYVTPSTQTFWFSGGGLEESGVENWRSFLSSISELDLIAREIRTQLYGNTAVTAAYVHGTVRFPWGGVEGGPWRYSEVRMLDRGKWKILQMHLSPMIHNLGQAPDRSFKPRIQNPAYPVGSGPLVLIDEAHFNQFTAWGTYLEFADFLRQDGYIVKESIVPFTRETLASASVLVIANAMSENVFADQGAPPLPAFKTQEVTAVREWVNGGGSLLFLTGHNPYPRSVEEMGRAFGIDFWNCGATYPGSRSGRLMYRRLEPPGGGAVLRGPDSVSYGAGGRLVAHAVTSGIDSVVTYMGAAFRIDLPHFPLLVFGKNVECWDEKDLIGRPQGMLQGALLEFGKGRVAVFGNSGMFASQFNTWAGTKTGMNNPIAAQNPRFLLNLMHWLTRVAD